MDEAAKLRWIAAHLLPQEAVVRGWLARHVRTLSSADADDLVQEAYARVWQLDFATIDNPRAFFFAVIRNLIAEQARRARIVPMERMGEIDALNIISEEPGPEPPSARGRSWNGCDGLLTPCRPNAAARSSCASSAASASGRPPNGWG